MLQRRERKQEDAMMADYARNHDLEIAIDLVLDAFSDTASHDDATEKALQKADQLYEGEESAQVQEIIKQFGESMRRDSRTKASTRWRIVD
jgi:hypothetical protein